MKQEQEAGTRIIARVVRIPEERHVGKGEIPKQGLTKAEVFTTMPAKKIFTLIRQNKTFREKPTSKFHFP